MSEPSDEIDDADLLSAIAEQNRDAFQRFYRRHSSLVYAIALRITGQSHDAEDVVTGVFWEIWEKSARYCPSKSTPRTYLVMLTRCRALDRKRGLSRRHAHFILDWLQDGQLSSKATSSLPADEIIGGEDRQIVAQAIAELDANQREAIELTFYDGLTHAASAEKLGIPLGTLKGRVRAALERLRKKLQICKSE